MNEAALQGIRKNGVAWRGTITGVKDAQEDLRAALDNEDVEAATKAMRRIHKAFAKRLGNEELSIGERDALEWFATDDPSYSFENDEVDDFKDELDFQLGVLYDWADYHRHLVK